jgi:hypothetical protein
MVLSSHERVEVERTSGRPDKIALVVHILLLVAIESFLYELLRSRGCTQLA